MSHNRDFWKKIWHMQVPHTVKVFIWRACHNALTTKANLCRRQITEDPLCPTCGIMEETTGHVLRGCPAAQAVWSMCSSKIQKRSIAQEDFMLVVENLHRFLDQADMELVAVLAQLLWFRRNALVHRRSISPIHSVVTQATQTLTAFHHAHSRPTCVSAASISRDLRWVAPPSDYVKGN